MTEKKDRSRAEDSQYLPQQATASENEAIRALKDLLERAEAEWGWMREEDGPCKELCALCHAYGCVVTKLDAAKEAIAKSEGR
jgi:hypothetical protein